MSSNAPQTGRFFEMIGLGFGEAVGSTPCSEEGHLSFPLQRAALPVRVFALGIKGAINAPRTDVGLARPKTLLGSNVIAGNVRFAPA
jgi:hypothetical protein